MNLAPLASRASALGDAFRLALARGGRQELHLVRLLSAVRHAGLPSLPLEEFQRRLPAATPLDGVSVRLNPRLRGFGSGSTAEMAALASLVAVRRPRRLLEFGTCDGASTWHLWANAPADAQITTLDLPSGTKAAGSSDEGLQGIAARPFLPRDPRVRLVEADSRDWSPDLSEVEFCFIDAGHSYACVRNDTEKALSVMSPGGLLVWHDAAWRGDGYGVNAYLKELRGAGREVFLLEAGPYDYCALAALIL